MDVGGINRIKPVAVPVSTEMRKNSNAAADRDPSGNANQQQRKPTHLSPEQEDEALRTLEALPAFSRHGFTAELVKEEGKAPHIVVRDKSGTVIRHMPYEDIIDLYVNRKSGNEKGQLLKKAA